MSKFDPKSRKGSVPNGQLYFVMCYAIRWFKCKLKPPKNQSIRETNCLREHGLSNLLLLCLPGLNWKVCALWGEKDSLGCDAKYRAYARCVGCSSQLELPVDLMKSTVLHKI